MDLTYFHVHWFRLLLPCVTTLDVWICDPSTRVRAQTDLVLRITHWHDNGGMREEQLTYTCMCAYCTVFILCVVQSHLFRLTSPSKHIIAWYEGRSMAGCSGDPGSCHINIRFGYLQLTASCCRWFQLRFAFSFDVLALMNTIVSVLSFLLGPASFHITVSWWKDHADLLHLLTNAELFVRETDVQHTR